MAHFIDQSYSSDSDERDMVTGHNLPLSMHVMEDGERRLRRCEVPDDRLGCFETFSQDETAFEAWQWSGLLEVYLEDVCGEVGGKWHYTYNENEQPPVRRVLPNNESTRAMVGTKTERSGCHGETSLCYLSENNCARTHPDNVSVPEYWCFDDLT